MCYEFNYAAIFFNIIGVLTWFYFCYKAGCFGAKKFNAWWEKFRK